MIHINEHITPAFSRGNTGIIKLTPAYSRKSFAAGGPAVEHSSVSPAPMAAPSLSRPVSKGQKTALGLISGGITRVKVSFGWNIKDSRCDVDASVFPVTAQGRVITDDWFVFYGQQSSPDGAITLEMNAAPERSAIYIDLKRLDSRVTRLIFVVTINEALENRLNFEMLNDVYIRVNDAASGRELVGYQLTEYYENVTSMTLGELYLHGGDWKFNPVGNGVNTDLAGQCAVYGVNIT